MCPLIRWAPLCVVRPDPDHAEERWVILGTVHYLVVVAAVYSYRDDNISRKRTGGIRKEYDFSKGVQGAVLEGDSVKLPITIRLDGAILDYFRANAERLGRTQGYQTLINEALKEYIQGARIEALLLSDDFAEKLSRSLKKKDLVG